MTADSREQRRLRKIAMWLKDKVVGKIERALLGTAISVLVFLVERRLKKSIREQEAKLGTNRRSA